MLHRRFILVSGQIQLRTPFSRPEGVLLRELPLYYNLGRVLNIWKRLFEKKYLTQCESVVYFEFYLGTLLPQLGFISPETTVLDKKFSVYDSQIWCQQGRAFVRNLATPQGRRHSSMKKKKMVFLSQANLDVSHALFVSLNWSARRSDFTSLLFHVRLRYKE